VGNFEELLDPSLFEFDTVELDDQVEEEDNGN
jgi:hypothetical protein